MSSYSHIPFTSEQINTFLTCQIKYRYIFLDNVDFEHIDTQYNIDTNEKVMGKNVIVTFNKQLELSDNIFKQNLLFDDIIEVLTITGKHINIIDYRYKNIESYYPQIYYISKKYNPKKIKVTLNNNEFEFKRDNIKKIVKKMLKIFKEMKTTPYYYYIKQINNSCEKCELKEYCMENIDDYIPF